MLRLFLVAALLLPDRASAAQARPSAERLLALPGRLLELPWWPVGRALDFAQRHALITRIQDLFFFNDEHTAGWFPNIASTGSGRGAGLLVFDENLFAAGHRGEAAFSVSGSEKFFARLRYAGPPLARRRSGFSLDYDRDGDTELYARAGPALGWKTTTFDRRSYALTRLRGRIWRERRLGALRAGVFGAADDGETGAAPEGESPPAELPGFSRRVTLGGGGLRLEWDAAPGGERAVRGARAAAELEAQASGDGAHGYARHFLETRIFVPLLAPRRALALRGSWERLRGLGSRQAPLFVLPTLDSDNRLRGFRRMRYRAPGAAALSAEYRYPVWVDWDAFYFIDAGQSYEREADLSFSRWSASHGPGLRFLSKARLLLTAQLGFTPEERRFELAMGKIF